MKEKKKSRSGLGTGDKYKKNPTGKKIKNVKLAEVEP